MIFVADFKRNSSPLRTVAKQVRHDIKSVLSLPEYATDPLSADRCVQVNNRIKVNIKQSNLT